MGDNKFELSSGWAMRINTAGNFVWVYDFRPGHIKKQFSIHNVNVKNIKFLPHIHRQLNGVNTENFEITLGTENGVFVSSPNSGRPVRIENVSGFKTLSIDAIEEIVENFKIHAVMDS